MKTFIHRFSKTVSCNCEVPESPPPPGSVTGRVIVWMGQPKKKHVREYVLWQHTVNRELADSWGIRLMHCYRVEKNRWEFWTYAPGEPPRRDKISDEEPSQPYTECDHLGVFDTNANEE